MLTGSVIGAFICLHIPCRMSSLAFPAVSPSISPKPHKQQEPAPLSVLCSSAPALHLQLPSLPCPQVTARAPAVPPAPADAGLLLALPLLHVSFTSVSFPVPCQQIGKIKMMDWIRSSSCFLFFFSPFPLPFPSLPFPKGMDPF